MLEILSGILDRYRGSGLKPFRYFKQVMLLLQGYLFAAVIGHAFDYYTVAIVLYFWVFMVIGYGQPWGAALYNRTPEQHLLLERQRYQAGDKSNWPVYEDWQKLDILNKRSAYYTLVLRGLLALPFALFDAAALVVAYAVAFPLAPYVAHKLHRYNYISDIALWPVAEFIRGAAAMSIVLWIGRL